MTGTLLLTVIGLVLDSQTLGVTRQPLPLVWPVAVLNVVSVQVLLPDLLGPVERVAVRAAVARAIRAGVALILVGAAAVTYVAAHDDPALHTLFLLLVAVGFGAATAGVEPWGWTLGVGMTAVGLLFITPAGATLSDYLAAVPRAASVLMVALSAAAYVWNGDRAARGAR